MAWRRWYSLQNYIIKYIHKLGLSEDKFFFLITIVIGAVCGLVAVSFHMLIEYLFNNVFELKNASNTAYLKLILTPTLGCLVCGVLLHFFFPQARGSGIPQLKASLFARCGRMSIKNTIAKFFLSALSIGTGSSVGREGPTVYITGGLASFIGKTFYLSAEKIKALVPVGAAAGLAAAFNTPLAAVTFTIEEIVGNFNTKILGSAVLAAVAAAAVERSILGNHPIFEVPPYALISVWEFGFYLVLGIAAGFVSLFFINALLGIRKLLKLRLPVWSLPLQPMIGGLCIGLMALVSPKIMGIGYDTVEDVLNGNLVFYMVVLLLIMKVFATVVSYSTGTAGGIFAPSLFIGAMLGGFMGYLFQIIAPGFVASPGAYALVGMGAVFSGIIRAPMTSVIIIFEMTHDYSIILPLMISNLISYAISQKFHKVPIYNALSMQDGCHIPSHEQEEELKHFVAEDAMNIHFESMNYDLSVVVATKDFDLKFSYYPVLDRFGDLLGMVSSDKIKEEFVKHHYQKKIAKIANRDLSIHAHPDQSLEFLMHTMHENHVHTIPIVDREDTKKLIGIVSKSDILHIYGLDTEY
ncbi:MAG: chloride channel protein [Pseudomonadota bacterium]